jgi:hypothetical protein
LGSTLGVVAIEKSFGVKIADWLWLRVGGLIFPRRGVIDLVTNELMVICCFSLDLERGG